MFFRGLLQAATLIPFLSNTASAQSSQTACNNSPSLCSRAYNNVTHLGAHDSPFLRDRSTSFSTSGNQYYNSTVQLNSGVRLLSAQVHKGNDSQTGQEKWRLCHSTCDLLDAGSLTSWLEEIKTWMDANENEVVTVLIVNSDNAKASDLGPQFEASGIDSYAYTPPTPGTRPQSWPTLQSLISNNTRLMTFATGISEPSTTYPYLMDEFTFIFENDFENESPSNYSCTPNRPRGLTTTEAADSGRMFLMNHFLYSTALFGIQTPNDTYVNVTNAQTGLGSLGTRLTNCTTVYSQAPTFVLVDFFNVGPAMRSVDAANGVRSAVGRATVSTEQPNENAPSDEGGAAERGASMLAVVVAVVVAVAFGM